MKTLYIAIFATFLFAVIIIYHDSKRNESISAIASEDGNKSIYVIVCEGTPVRLKSSIQEGNFTGIKTHSQFQVTPFQDVRQAKSH